MAGGIVWELAAAGFDDAVEVGRGGGGVVYRCTQMALGRSVAIKVLGSELDEADRERFLREGFAMGGLSGHPNIVNILQVGVTESDRPFIVMPYHASGSLADRVRREGPMSWPDALRLGVKLSGALETAHRTGTLHRDIKPGNVLVNEYGEPQLSDFGTARIAGGYKTITGFFTGTLSYTAPEVLGGKPPTACADVYSLASTMFAVIAGQAAYERKTDEELIAHYLRITSEPVPDMRMNGIPADVCAVIEKAMSAEPAARYATAEEFGRALQLVQRKLGLPTDHMALSGGTAVSGEHAVVGGLGSHAPATRIDPVITGSGPIKAPLSGDSDPGMFAHTAAFSASSPPRQAFQPPQSQPPPPPPPPPSAPPSAGPEPVASQPNSGRKRILIAVLAVLAALALVVSGVYIVAAPKDGGDAAQNPSQTAAPNVPPAPEWKSIADARVARTGVAATQADGTIWVFGGVGTDGKVSGAHEGFDPPIDSWKGGDDLPVPVQHAMAVTWSGTPVVLGGWRTEGADTKVATDRVWRVVNSKWVELPPLLQPRAAAAAAVVGDRIIVTGGVGTDGQLLNTTEIFDGSGWTLGAPIPTPRQLLAVASDDETVYTVGGTNGTAAMATVESYDPAANRWTALTDMPAPRSDLGAAIVDGRLVAVGGESGGKASDTVAAFDLAMTTWSSLPDLATARHGMAVAAVGKNVYAIGGSTGASDDDVTPAAEALKLPPRIPQPAAAWRVLPDAPTPRLMMAWAVLDGKIWVAGGIRDGETLATVETFDPATGAWQPQPALPIPLHHATATTYRGEVVVMGGASDNLAEASDKVFAFRNGSWTELPPMKHGRAAAAAAVVGDKLVVLGGQDDKQLVPPTEIFDGTSWSEGAELPVPREHLAAVSDGGYVYAVGGRELSSDENSGAFERFDPASGTWESLPEMPTPRGSYGAAVVEGRIVAVGGEVPTRVLPTVEMYDITGVKWTSLAPLATPVHGQVVAAVGDTLYVIGGADRPTHEGAVATVQALDFR
ncbi:serine/threonine-protein kinase [Mycolicibacterium arenosum]|uniref:Protein kinase n=1 Tax=Mycolicibacterium arenosum TaxID=2952157 RepID=A0ABT1LXU0_9MYCO|nr:serine/threonine-protein kinase [Mycolicibacterium sp. CAU 1645]MCP9271713.1 protein kinase [Mycolicibacterium sp. CAU 1645]